MPKLSKRVRANQELTPSEALELPAGPQFLEWVYLKSSPVPPEREGAKAEAQAGVDRGLDRVEQAKLLCRRCQVKATSDSNILSVKVLQ